MMGGNKFLWLLGLFCGLRRDENGHHGGIDWILRQRWRDGVRRNIGLNAGSQGAFLEGVRNYGPGSMTS